ncbi:hypothetical protein HDV05_004984 [Chytridiales sp. JEL 0842]|nr:hypothetical protein HDV05_004984 [Chytridiales sp. JEL 0842]
MPLMDHQQELNIETDPSESRRSSRASRKPKTRSTTAKRSSSITGKILSSERSSAAIIAAGTWQPPAGHAPDLSSKDSIVTAMAASIPAEAPTIPRYHSHERSASSGDCRTQQRALSGGDISTQPPLDAFHELEQKNINSLPPTPRERQKSRQRSHSRQSTQQQQLLDDGIDTDTNNNLINSAYNLQGRYNGRSVSDLGFNVGNTSEEFRITEPLGDAEEDDDNDDSETVGAPLPSGLDIQAKFVTSESLPPPQPRLTSADSSSSSRSSADSGLQMHSNLLPTTTASNYNQKGSAESRTRELFDNNLEQSLDDPSSTNITSLSHLLPAPSRSLSSSHSKNLLRSLDRGNSDGFSRKQPSLKNLSTLIAGEQDNYESIVNIDASENVTVNQDSSHTEPKRPSLRDSALRRSRQASRVLESTSSNTIQNSSSLPIQDVQPSTSSQDQRRPFESETALGSNTSARTSQSSSQSPGTEKKGGNLIIDGIIQERRRVKSARTPKEEAYEKAKSKVAATNNGAKKKSNEVIPLVDLKERERLVEVHRIKLLNGTLQDEAKLDSITNLTARLLNSEVCILTLVDHSKVVWRSICDRGGYIAPDESDETRSESFCHYAIRDDKRGGFVVLDAKREQRFRDKPLVKRGLHFYAGAPIVTSKGHKIGVLSIRGPARSSFTAQEADILRQMTEWAAGELEVWRAKEDVELRDGLNAVLARIRSLDKGKMWDDDTGRRMTQEEVQFLTEASTVLSALWERMELRQALSVITSSTDVTPLINKRLNEAARALQTSSVPGPSNSPKGSTSRLEAPPRALSSSSLGSKSWAGPVAAGRVAIAVAVLEPVLPTSSDALVADSHAMGGSLTMGSLNQLNAYPSMGGLVGSGGASGGVGSDNSLGASEWKGGEWGVVTSRVPEEKAKWVIGGGHLNGKGKGGVGKVNTVQQSKAQQQWGEKPGAVTTSPIVVPESKNIWGGAHSMSDLKPKGAVELFTDFCQMFDVLAQQQGLTRVKRFGNLVVVAVGLDDDGKACSNLANLSLDLTRTLDEYHKETGIEIQAKIGIHAEYLPLDFRGNMEALDEVWISLVNYAYHLETISTATILVSEDAHSLIRNTFYFLPRGTLYTKPLGASKVYTLTRSVEDSRFHLDSMASALDVRRRQHRESGGDVAESGRSSLVRAGLKGWGRLRDGRKVAPLETGGVWEDGEKSGRRSEGRGSRVEGRGSKSESKGGMCAIM